MDTKTTQDKDTHMDFIFDDFAEDAVDFDSEAIEALAYNREEALLYVEFQSGGEYIYSDVAESTYNMFKDAPSVGTFYRQFISGKYTSERVQDVSLTARWTTATAAQAHDDAYADMNIDPNAESQEAPLADWERELLGLPAEDETDEEEVGTLEDFGLSVPPSGLVASRVRVGSRFAVKYQIAGTGIIAESEIEANSGDEALTHFYELFASELPGQSPVVIALTQYF